MSTLSHVSRKVVKRMVESKSVQKGGNELGCYERVGLPY